MAKSLAVVFSATVAFGAGIVAGMLMAPESGEKNRKRIAAQLRAYTDRVERQLSEVEKSISKVEEQVVETSNELRTRVRDAAGRAREQITGDVGDSAAQWEMDRNDLAQDLPKMPKI